MTNSYFQSLLSSQQKFWICIAAFTGFVSVLISIGSPMLKTLSMSSMSTMGFGLMFCFLGIAGYSGEESRKAQIIGILCFLIGTFLLYKSFFEPISVAVM